jgi:hypothetical protein
MSNSTLVTIENTIKHVRNVLTNDLVDPNWKENNRKVSIGEHSAHAVEAIYFLIGMSKSGLIPAYHLNKDDTEYWWLETDDGCIFDPTFDNSKCDIQLYEEHMSGTNLIGYGEPSKKARIIIERYNEAVKAGSV